jgi:hypothetical protein
MLRFYNALYAGDVRGRFEVLRDVGMCKSYLFYLIHLIIMLTSCQPFSVPHRCKN